jgi:hypothetical protein
MKTVVFAKDNNETDTINAKIILFKSCLLHSWFIESNNGMTTAKNRFGFSIKKGKLSIEDIIKKIGHKIKIYKALGSFAFIAFFFL